jgi:hypothetical protein
VSVWVIPPTWVNGTLSAANLQTLSDDLSFLKGAFDLITGSTTADTGTATLLEIHRGASGNDVFRAFVLSEANARFVINAAGTQLWGSGSAVADVNLYRSGAGNLKTDNRFSVDQVQVNAAGGGQAIEIQNGGYVDITERAAAPGAPSANIGRLFTRDNGSGKTQLCVIFSSGGVIVLATQP